MKASDLFVQCLENEGIEYIFGVPGEENADFMMSLEQSERITFVLCRHEQGAAFMAEVYGRLTGNPAGCLGTLGPGAANLITGVADANMDRSPILVLTGQGDSQRLHKESHQIMDVVGMFGPVTKWGQIIRHPNNIPEVVRKAVRLARSENAGRLSHRAAGGHRAARCHAAAGAGAPVPSSGSRRHHRRPRVGTDTRRKAATHPGRQRHDPEACQRAATAVRRVDRHRCGDHIHGEGLHRHG